MKSRLLINLAELYDEALTDTRLKTYLVALKDLTPKELNIACQRMFKDKTIRKMPLPADFHEIINPTKTDSDSAKLYLVDIHKAVMMFGWPNAKEAKEFLGESVWLQIERIGGWEKICRDDLSNPANISGYARFRDNIQTGLKHGDNKHEQLEAPKEILQLVTNNDDDCGV